MVSYECPVPAQEACKLHVPQDRGEKTFSVITQTLPDGYSIPKA